MAKVKKKVEIKKLDVDDVEQTHLQQVFLDEFLKYGKFTAGCNVLQGVIGEDINAETVVGQWIEECPEFKVEFDKAKKIVARVGAVKAEEFLNEVGSGKQKTGKDSGISTANVVGAHMVLEADDKAKWSSKIQEDKNVKRKILITEYEVARPDNKTTVEITEGDFKRLPSPEDNDG